MDRNLDVCCSNVQLCHMVLLLPKLVKFTGEWYLLMCLCLSCLAKRYAGTLHLEWEIVFIKKCEIIVTSVCSANEIIEKEKCLLVWNVSNFKMLQTCVILVLHKKRAKCLVCKVSGWDFWANREQIRNGFSKCVKFMVDKHLISKMFEILDIRNVCWSEMCHIDGSQTFDQQTV